MCSIFVLTGKSVSLQEAERAFYATVSRGPDMSKLYETEEGIVGFHRLAIMGLNAAGMQPFTRGKNFCVCNGELYGFRREKRLLEEKGYEFASDSDCEILLPMYELYGTETFARLDAEFACVIYDGEKREYVAARDPIGIRPLYYGYLADGKIAFASEPKNLTGLCDKILPFPPGHYYKGGKFVCYRDVTKVERVIKDDLDTVCENIRLKLIEGVEKRLDADAPVGFLLSGGLDSSLVCAIAQKSMKKPIRTFAVGMEKDAIDLKYAKEVAEFIGSEHTEIYMTREEVLSSLDFVI
ncbi:MAG: asparagine synthase-related protein, partial [Candidatus Gallimonas sp.]